MAQQLSVVVTCTDRKSLRPHPSLLVRNLRGGSVERRVTDWVGAVTRAKAACQLADLYQGESWTTSVRLSRTLQRTARTRLLVASAGLGLRDVDELAPSYSATFSPGASDAVAQDWDGRRVWWGGIQDQLGSLRLEGVKGSLLLVLSEAYARAMSDELVQLGASGRHVVMFGGHTDVPGIVRIPSDRRLRMALGGTMSGLNQRMAEHWVELAQSGEVLGSDRHMRRWTQWTKQAARDISIHRTKVQDVDVLDWIDVQRRRDPALSMSVAHRRFRDAGFACEQKRFKSLFGAAGSRT